MTPACLRVQYPLHVPCVVNFEKVTLKLLIPKSSTICEFHMCVRRRLMKKNVRLKPEDAIFLFTGGVIPPTASLISEYDNNSPEPVTFIAQRETTFG